MTAAILSPGEQLQMLAPIDQMPAAFNNAWHRSHYHTMSVPMDHYWPQTHGLVVGDIHDNDLRIFHRDSGYDKSFHPDADPMISPPMGYIPDTHFGSDMDVGTPSTSSFPDVTHDGYHHLQTSNLHNQHLQPASRYERAPSAHSPQSSISGVSPHQTFARLSDVSIKEEQRPSLFRSITAPAAPEQLRSSNRKLANRKPAVNSTKGSASENAEDEDDDYIPSEDYKLSRGRKRQRIPHTAVEKRYRENLNAHLDKLRQTVPSLAGKKGLESGEGMKPSKCEVLNGAIEHILSQARENNALREEVENLRRCVAGIHTQETP